VSVWVGAGALRLGLDAGFRRGGPGADDDGLDQAGRFRPGVNAGLLELAGSARGTCMDQQHEMEEEEGIRPDLSGRDPTRANSGGRTWPGFGFALDGHPSHP